MDLLSKTYLRQKLDGLQQGFMRLSWYSRTLVSALLVLPIIALGTYAFVVRPPINFPVGSVVHIPSGASFGEILDVLQEANVIRSPFALRLFVEFSRGDENIRAGDYFFHTPRNLFDVARRMLTGDYGISPVRVTIPEGATRADIVHIFGKRQEFERFNAEAFLATTEGKEGYLFPDTYFFLPTVEAAEVARVLEENFFARTKELADEIEASGHTLTDIVIMASLLEKEGRGLTMRRDIAGVLWNRLEINMPLQVDAVFLAINGKSTFDLTLNDLAMDSPYNTYRYKGLPPGPIANPGLDSLLAAVTPSDSEYLFYLSDMSGETHYARNFNEHKANKRRYLD
jgi:UPF0755 protein